MLICTGFSYSVHFISQRVKKQIVLFRPCALLDNIQLLGDLFMTHYLCCESLTAVHYAAVCFPLCFLNCISLCCYWDPCAAPNWLLSGSWVKSRLVTHWTPVFFSSRCLFLIAVLLCSRSGTEAKPVSHWQSGNILLVEVQSSFFLPLLALALQPDLLVAKLFWGKFQILFQNFRFTLWLYNMSV